MVRAAPVLSVHTSRAEIVAVAFGDTIVDVAHLHAGSPAYRIGEGSAARLPTLGTGLPDPIAFALLQAHAGAFWLALVPGMRAVVIDVHGRRSLESVAAESTRVVESETGRELLLVPGETIWLEHQQLRFRVRLVEAAQPWPSPRELDRGWLAALISSACLALCMLALLHVAPPALRIDDDPHAALRARLLPREPRPEPPEEIEPPRDVLRPVERSLPGLADAPDAGTPTALPSPSLTRSPGRASMWVPLSAAQAVGHYGRSWDPVESARHAGILAPLDGRPFARDSVFDPAIDDAQLWASTAGLSETLPWVAVSGERDPMLGTGLIGGGRGEGVVGWGSFGDPALGQLGHLSVGAGVGHDRAALCNGDDRRAFRGPRVPSARIGQVSVQGGLDHDLARRIIRAHAHELRGCASTHMPASSAELAGLIDFTVSEGRVGAVVVDPAFSGELNRCIARAFQRWSFPRATGATNLISVQLRLSR